MRNLKSIVIILLSAGWSSFGWAQEIQAPYLKLDEAFFTKPDPKAQVWNQVSEQVVPLFPQNITTPSLQQPTVTQLKVRALHNGRWLAVRLEWEDKTKNIHVATDQASDACAMQLPFGKADQTSPFMGNKGAPVTIIHWKAIWQEDSEGRFQKVTDLHPNTWVDTYRFGIQAASDLKNPVSWPGRKVPVEELIAEGFGTLTTQINQNASGAGLWKNGKWLVVLTRPLKSGDSQEHVLQPGAETALAFAVWEGGNLNVGARKNYALWTTLILEEKGTKK